MSRHKKASAERTRVRRMQRENVRDHTVRGDKLFRGLSRVAGSIYNRRARL